MPIDYDNATGLLGSTFELAQSDLMNACPPDVGQELFYYSSFESVFRSNTQAFREALLGCAIARILDLSTNIRQPYVNQGPDAFNGRTLDERVVNPFLQENRVPCSRGPYLSVFRRSVVFDNTTREGVRDKQGYDQFLNIISYLEGTDDEPTLRSALRYMLYKFLELREQSTVPLTHLNRMSLEQLDALTAGLLATPSGGRFPMLIVIATYIALKHCFNPNWQVDWQGINVADSASGVGGDVTVTCDGDVVVSAEVTERPIDRSRLVSTFNTKIAPNGIKDYLFFVMPGAATPEARAQARQYFAQGHDIDFLVIRDWVIITLGTLGTRGRSAFNAAMIDLLDSPDVPATLKMSWNEQINRVVSAQG